MERVDLRKTPMGSRLIEQAKIVREAGISDEVVTRVLGLLFVGETNRVAKKRMGQIEAKDVEHVARIAQGLS